ncbi:MAG: hypothetical protein ACK5FX_10985 [Flavobacteriia bacterium]
MKGFLFSLLIMTLFSALRAQTNYSWNGSASTAWATASNWTPTGVPGASDNVTIVTGSIIVY